MYAAACQCHCTASDIRHRPAERKGMTAAPVMDAPKNNCTERVCVYVFEGTDGPSNKEREYATVATNARATQEEKKE